MWTPSALLPAPREITGTGSVSARYWATSSVVTSHRIEKQPASTIAHASSTSSLARSAVLPCAMNPPSCGIRIGVTPMWPCTGMPAFTMASMFWRVVLVALALHHLGAALRRRSARRSRPPAAGETWKLQYGMSTMRSPYFDPRSTAFAMHMTSSKVTEVVDSCPKRIIPPVSDTHRMSMPSAVGDDRGAVVVDRDLNDRVRVALLLVERREGDLLELLLGLLRGHSGCSS